ncbi:hypothetical protein K469DRAFT_232134 [Zopfia rhizophila CBS 207.26]|uniref:Uncharacterized protein n=1 Tax=Zopfia rhizophila CBS 207.26 TaxID=1314779 RepID=A0A6A6DVT4_9PEZI|nr:hypothetical protein K469DRAFT_232134 [Zopfia rhizophila CBS 207.26]
MPNCRRGNRLHYIPASRPSVCLGNACPTTRYRSRRVEKYIKQIKVRKGDGQCEARPHNESLRRAFWCRGASKRSLTCSWAISDILQSSGSLKHRT